MCCEERFKNPAAKRFGNATTIVAHRDPEVVIGPSLDSEIAAGGHGVEGVGCEVDEHLLDLDGVGRKEEAGVDLDADIHVAGLDAAEQLVSFEDGGREVQRFAGSRLARGHVASEVEQTLGEIGAMAGRYLGEPEGIESVFFRGRKAVDGDLQVAEDQSELVIEIVSDSAGEGAGQLEALDVLKLRGRGHGSLVLGSKKGAEKILVTAC